MSGDPMIGRMVGQYRIERTLGAGGMAIVYEATDTSLQRQVALKVMQPRYANEQSFRARFRQEAQAAARLDHPNIVHIHYFPQELTGELYIVMELIRGGNLRKYIKSLHEQGVFLTYPEAIEVMRQVAEGLHYAHDRGMVHRDIKPDNVLLQPDDNNSRINYRPIITDFGLAKLLSGGDDDAVTEEQPIGTYPYMSPEQTRADPVDHRSDIYSFGVMLYELTVGRLPFNPKNIAEAHRMHGQMDVPLPSRLRRGFPADLEAVIIRCLEKNPADRFQSVGELAVKLREMLKPVERIDLATQEVVMVQVDQLETAAKTAVMEAPLRPQPPYDPPARTEEEKQADCLIFYKRDGSFVVRLDEPDITIGREQNNQVMLDADYVSRTHLRLERKPNGRYYITDLGSTNGTWFGEKRLETNIPVIFDPDTYIRIGEYWVQLVLGLKPVDDVQTDGGAYDVESVPMSSVRISTEAGDGIDTLIMGIPPEDARPKDAPPRLTNLEMGRNRLVIYHPGRAPQVFLLQENRYYIGRNERRNLRLDSRFVSRLHARIDRRPDGDYTIVDLRSTNGVWIDNERIPTETPTKLVPGRTVRIGDFWINFELSLDVSLVGIQATAAEEVGDTIDTVVMVKPLDEAIPHYSQPRLNEEMLSSDRLVFFSEDHGLQIEKIDRENIAIGRGANQNIRLKGRRVSREHITLECRSDGSIHVTDNSSQNGSWMGDTLLVPGTQVEWPKNEIIRLGNYWMKFERGTHAALGFGLAQDERGLVGRVFGGFRLDRYIGRNALAAVYKATDLQLSRDVAMRIMRPQMAAEPLLKQRFLEEARLLSRLDHPNVVRVLTYNELENEVFMVMELITGGTLRQVINRYRDSGRQIDLNDAIDLVVQLANGLHYAHQQGLVHREIKPENITVKKRAIVGPIETYEPVLTDFALSRFTETGDIFEFEKDTRSYPYMSPEQCLNSRTDVRSDVYELGIILFELIIGVPPFQPRSIAEAVRMHTREPHPRLDERRSNIPVQLQEVMDKALQKDPNNRYQTASEMARALSRLQLYLSEDEESAVASGFFDPQATVVMDAALPALMPPRTIPPRPEGELQRDRLVFYSDTHPTYYVDLTRSLYTIGRDEAQDIRLDGQTVSRIHARVERDDTGLYRILDMGGKNGVWLGNYRLIPEVAEVWDVGQTVRIGEYWVRIETAESINAAWQAAQPVIIPGLEQYKTDPFGEEEPARPAAPRPKPKHDKIGVIVKPTIVRVAPGSSVALSIEVANQSDRVDHFTVQAVGLPSEWYTQPPESLYLLPYERETTSVTLHPPISSTSTAGEHAFEIRVTSRAEGVNAVRTQCVLVIEALSSFVTELYPDKVRGRGRTELTIRNTGNTNGTYTLEARDPEQAVRFSVPGKQYLLPPGRTEAVPFYVSPRRRILFGREKSLPFEVKVTPNPATPGNTIQTTSGELVSRPTCAVWMLFLILFMLLLCGVVSFLIFNQVRSSENSQRTATVVAMSSAVIATETASALGDDDGDTLNNSLEATLGTFPDLVDTDGDGLNDGDEVRVWQTNPLNRDSDGDGLSDSEEIERGTDPNNRDTDEDGIPDAEDDTPSFRSTETPTPFPVAALEDCPGSPIPGRLTIGMTGQVEPGGVNNRLRDQPSKAEGEIIGFMPPEDFFKVVEGPVCDETDFLRWWKVEWNGLEAWTAEGEGDEYYLRPPDAEDEEGGSGGGSGLASGSPSQDAAAIAASLPQPGSVELDRALMGIQLHSDASYNEALAAVDTIAFGWVKLQADWGFLQPDDTPEISANLQAFASQLSAAKSSGYNVLVSVVKAPSWARSVPVEDGPPDDPEDLARFMDMLLGAAGANIDAIEVWNEPNLRREWVGSLPFSGAGYMMLFEPAYRQIRGYSEDIIIITAGLAPAGDTRDSVNDRTYLEEMYAAGLASYENIAIGIHPYGWANRPDVTCCAAESQGWDDQPSFFFLHNITDMRNIMDIYEHDAQLWPTEFGYTTWEDIGNPPEPWMSFLTVDDQAEYIIRAFEVGQSLGYVGPMFLWNLNFGNSATIAAGNEIAGYSLLILNDDGGFRARPAFERLSITPTTE